MTEVFERERDFRAISQKISQEGGVADVSGYTDYGRVWLEFFEEISEDLDPRSTVIVLGDARTNGREPHAEVFARISERAGRTFWLNPEPRLYWNYGDSVMSAYERHCDARLRVLDDQAPGELRQRDRRRRPWSRTRAARPPRRSGSAGAASASSIIASVSRISVGWMLPVWSS